MSGAISHGVRGILMLMATAVAWGGMFPVIKPMLKILDPVTLTFIRFVFSSIILAILLFLFEGKKSFNFENKFLPLWWFGTLGFAGFGILLVMGISHTVPQHAAVIPALMPLITVVILSIRTRHFPNLQTLSAIALGIVGVLFVVSNGNLKMIFSGEVGYGEFLIFCGATCWVLYTIGASHFPHWSGLRYTTLSIVLGTMTIASIEAIALMAGWITLPSIEQLLPMIPSFAYLVIAASVMGFIFWNGGMRILGAAKGVLFINLVPVTAFIIAIVCGNHPQIWEVVGVVLVVTALFINSLNMKFGT